MHLGTGLSGCLRVCGYWLWISIGRVHEVLGIFSDFLNLDFLFEAWSEAGALSLCKRPAWLCTMLLSCPGGARCGFLFSCIDNVPETNQMSGA